MSKPTTETSTEAIIKFNHTDQMGLIAIIVGSQFSSDTHLAHVCSIDLSSVNLPSTRIKTSICNKIIQCKIIFIQWFNTIEPFTIESIVFIWVFTDIHVGPPLAYIAAPSWIDNIGRLQVNYYCLNCL